jgi:hypothetical protein
MQCEFTPEAHMELTLADVAIHKSGYDPATVLAPWQWRLRGQFASLLPTVLGHLFLERADGTIWFLDTWSGELYQVATDYNEFRSAMSGDQEFLNRWFTPELVVALRNAGLHLQPGECYTPFVSPGLGGTLTVDNFMVATLRVHLGTTAAECQALGGGSEPPAEHT